MNELLCFNLLGEIYEIIRRAYLSRTFNLGTTIFSKVKLLQFKLLCIACIGFRISVKNIVVIH